MSHLLVIAQGEEADTIVDTAYNTYTYQIEIARDLVEGYERLTQTRGLGNRLDLVIMAPDMVPYSKYTNFLLNQSNVLGSSLKYIKRLDHRFGCSGLSLFGAISKDVPVILYPGKWSRLVSKGPMQEEISNRNDSCIVWRPDEEGLKKAIREVHHLQYP